PGRLSSSVHRLGTGKREGAVAPSPGGVGACPHSAPSELISANRLLRRKPRFLRSRRSAPTAQLSEDRVTLHRLRRPQRSARHPQRRPARGGSQEAFRGLTANDDGPLPHKPPQAPASGTSTRQCHKPRIAETPSATPARQRPWFASVPSSSTPLVRHCLDRRLGRLRVQVLAAPLHRPELLVQLIPQRNPRRNVQPRDVLVTDPVEVL